jgi:hypothetical protein
MAFEPCTRAVSVQSGLFRRARSPRKAGARISGGRDVPLASPVPSPIPAVAKAHSVRVMGSRRAWCSSPSACCHMVVTLLLHCCYTVVTLLLHCCYAVVTLLLHCCYTVVTLLSHCCYTVITLLSPVGSPVPVAPANGPHTRVARGPVHRRPGV